MAPESEHVIDLTAKRPALAVVIPVRDAGPLLAPCLTGVRAQLLPGDELVVVDDGSQDDSRAEAERLGARVLHRDVGRGPYAARNSGWPITRAPAVVFTDVRCRPLPGWLSSLRSRLAAGAQLVGSPVRVPAGDSAGQQMLHRMQPFAVEQHVDGPVPAYHPAVNLAVTRTLLHRLGGFAEVRHGGDIDLCWRAQLSGDVVLEVLDHVGMEWVSGDEPSDVLDRCARHGRTHALMRTAYEAHGWSLDRGVPLWLSAALLIDRSVRGSSAEARATWRWVARAAYRSERAYAQAWAQAHEQPDPIGWAWSQLLVEGAQVPRVPQRVFDDA